VGRLVPPKTGQSGVTGIDFEWPGLLETDVLADSFLYNNFDQPFATSSTYGPWGDHDHDGKTLLSADSGRSSAAMGATSVRISSPIILGRMRHDHR